MPADHWMQALERGEETDLVEIPANWYLDDLPPMMFIKKSPNSPRLHQPQGHRVAMAETSSIGVYREYDEAVFPITIHPTLAVAPGVADAGATH